jgi:predicted peptidase
MKTKFLTLLAFSIILLSCGDDENGSPTNPTGAPSWTANYPNVAQGAVSVDLNLQTDKASQVHYVISDKALNLSADEIRQQTSKTTNAAIKFKGVVETKANEENRKTVTNLSEHKKYFAYLVAQNVKDTLAQKVVESFEFTTYYRQDTAEYHSTAENRQVKYLIYQPEDALKYPDKVYPICFFLGGNGEVASADKPINMIRNGSLPEYIHKGNDVPMIVMSIQHTALNWNTSLIDEGVNHGLATYPVDTKKVYLTGISGGGFGCWNYSVDHADKLTAIVPISGGGPKGKACNLKNVAIWAFHNQTDNTVAPSNTKDMIAAVNACPPNKEVKMLIFPDTGHDCWRRVYDQKHADWKKSPSVDKFDIYAWLLSKSK